GRRDRLRSAMNRIRAYERSLTERLIAGLQAMSAVRILGITDPTQFHRRVPTVSFQIDGRPPDDVAARLAERGICSWAGDHYAPEPMVRLGLNATQRIGLVHYNTPDEIDRFLDELELVVRSPRTSLPNATSRS